MKTGPLILRFIVLWTLTLDLMAQSRIQSGPLEELVRQAKAQRSNALFVNEDGNPVREEFFDSRDRRIYVFSVTKLFSGLAVGLAWDRKLIPSIDEPVARYFPGEAKDPGFEKIRIRHLLQHTSGIETTQGSRDIYPQKDFVRFALQSPIVSEPGEVYQYNNRAINLIPGILRKVTGKSMEAFLVEHLFKPLDIRDYRFGRDAAGNTWGMDGLEIKASDLIKVGRVLANRGRWKDQQIISERWLDVAMQGNLVRLHRAAPTGCGFFCMDLGGGVVIAPETIDLLVRGGLSEALAGRLRVFVGREYARASDLGAALQSGFKTDELESISAAAGREMHPLYRKVKGSRMVYHDGDLGNYLIVLPDDGIAVVRTIDQKRGRSGPHAFEEIFGLSARLVSP
jgi:CubicO group peptidase (beta-lactamase class C family)